MKFCKCTERTLGWVEAPEWGWWVCSRCHWPSEYAYIEGEMPPPPKHLRGITPRTVGDLVELARAKKAGKKAPEPVTVRGRAAARSTMDRKPAPTSRRSAIRAQTGRARASGS